MRPLSLSKEMYADVAPLSIPLANHLYTYFQQKAKTAHLEDMQSLFLQEIAEKREAVYLYLDSFVRNRNKPNTPHNLLLTPELVRHMFAPYTPNREVVQGKTYDVWLRNGWIKHTAKGQPVPDWVAALAIARMCIQGKRLIGGSLPDDEPPWWCYAQESPTSAIIQVPLTALPLLPAKALAWTRWAGATWDPLWFPLGRYHTTVIGAIRFAGARLLDEQYVEYNVSFEDIYEWKPEYREESPEALVPPLEMDSIQELARRALLHLTPGRLIY